MAKTAEQTTFQREFLAVKTTLEDAKKALTEREWTSLMDILARYAAYELGEDE